MLSISQTQGVDGRILFIPSTSRLPMLAFNDSGFHLDRLISICCSGRDQSVPSSTTERK